MSIYSANLRINNGVAPVHLPKEAARTLMQELVQNELRDIRLNPQFREQIEGLGINPDKVLPFVNTINGTPAIWVKDRTGTMIKLTVTDNDLLDLLERYIDRCFALMEDQGPAPTLEKTAEKTAHVPLHTERSKEPAPLQDRAANRTHSSRRDPDAPSREEDERSLQRHRQERDVLQRSLDQAEERLQEIQSSPLENLRARIRELEEALRKMTAERDGLRGQLGQAAGRSEREKETLLQRIQDLDLQLEALHRNIGELTAAYQELLQKNDHLERELTLARQERVRCLAEISRLEALVEEDESLRTDLEAARHRQTQLEGYIARLHEEIASLERANNALIAHNRTQLHTIDSLKQQLRALQSQLTPQAGAQDLRTQLQQNQAKIRELEAQLEALRAERPHAPPAEDRQGEAALPDPEPQVDLQPRVDELEAELARARAYAESLQKAYEEPNPIVEGLNRDIASLKKRIAYQNSLLASQERDLAQAQAKITSLQTDLVEALKADDTEEEVLLDAPSLEEQLHEAQANALRLEEELSQMREKNNSLMQELRNLQNALPTVEIPEKVAAHIAQLQAKITALEESYPKRINHLIAINSQLKSANAQLKAELNSARGEDLEKAVQTAVQKREEELNKTIDELRSALAASEKEKAEKTKKVSELQEQVDKLLADTRKQAEELANQIARRESAEKAKSEKESENEALKNDLTAAQALIESQLKALAALQEQVKEMSQLKSELADKTEHLAQVLATNEKLAAEATLRNTTDERNKELSQTIAQLREQIDTLTQRETDLLERVTDLERQNQELRESLNRETALNTRQRQEHTDAIAALNEEVAKYKTQAEELDAANRDLSARLDEETAKNRELERRLNELEKLPAQLEAERERVRKLGEELANLQQVNKGNSELQAALDEALAKNKELQRALDAAPTPKALEAALKANEEQQKTIDATIGVLGSQKLTVILQQNKQQKEELERLQKMLQEQETILQRLAEESARRERAEKELVALKMETSKLLTGVQAIVGTIPTVGSKPIDPKEENIQHTLTALRSEFQNLTDLLNELRTVAGTTRGEDAERTGPAHENMRATIQLLRVKFYRLSRALQAAKSKEGDSRQAESHQKELEEIRVQAQKQLSMMGDAFGERERALKHRIHQLRLKLAVQIETGDPKKVTDQAALINRLRNELTALQAKLEENELALQELQRLRKESESWLIEKAELTAQLKRQEDTITSLQEEVERRSQEKEEVERTNTRLERQLRDYRAARELVLDKTETDEELGTESTKVLTAAVENFVRTSANEILQSQEREKQKDRDLERLRKEEQGLIQERETLRKHLAEKDSRIADLEFTLKGKDDDEETVGIQTQIIMRQGQELAVLRAENENLKTRIKAQPLQLRRQSVPEAIAY